ncbi:unnamed protein product [Lactuca virosa]|uniref:Uncharacterized protein n=1 Tax=Lactuca virosa TaxID=75947 RepID=A0AAU9MZI2_9ASTR|nr:unnamed protein product [Lactuca virosa]
MSNIAKLVKKVLEAVVNNQLIALHDMLMKSTLDSIFKVGFRFDLDTLSGLDEGDKDDDILSRFLIESEQNPRKLSDEYLRDISLGNVALEAKEATGSSDYTNSIHEFSLKLTESALDKMHYLQAALTETLQVHCISRSNLYEGWNMWA